MTGVFLSVIKTAKVFSVCKKDSKIDYSNYRPISRDCIIFLIRMLSKTYSLEPEQHYYTFHALINITENIRKSFDNGKIGCGVF